MGNSRLGDNIRALRKAYGETQEGLGAVLAVEKNTVSYYENGNREPNKDMLHKIAGHFMVSVDELMFCDFRGMGKIKIDNTLFFRSIDRILPIMSSEESLKCKEFKKAYERHKKFYEKFRNLSMKNQEAFDDIDSLDECGELYLEAYEQKGIKEEAAVNYLSIWLLMFMLIKSAPRMYKNQPAVLTQAAAKDPKARDIIDNFNPNIEKEAEKVLSELREPEFEDVLDEMITVIKSSYRWSNLADYYIALKYLWNIVENGLDMELNRTVGKEMMQAFACVGNVYAKRYLEIQMKQVESSQSVDEKK